MAEVVGRDLIRNAVTLNSTTVSVARVIGPAIAGVLVSTVGLGWCFIANAASFGDAKWHREQVAEAVLAGATAPASA